MTALAGEEFAAARVLAAPEPLRSFNEAGVLAAADVHVALTLADLAGEVDGAVRLAVALAVRAPRLGNVFVDLATVRDTAAVESDEVVDLAVLPWPEAAGWVDAVAASDRLVGVGEDDAWLRPLRLLGSRLYLDRYLREERQVAADLIGSGDDVLPGVDPATLAAGIARLFPRPDDHAQRSAAACALLRRLSVIAGGPGTGKTTTVARIAALLHEQALAADRPEPLIALAAPTGKAAARLEESVHEEAARLPIRPAVRAALLELRATTIHRLLGYRPGGAVRHDRGNRLPHDVVIVDETSMVALSLMARLLAAIRPDARTVLIGDPGQLTAIEAGAVLRDIVGPAADGAAGGSSTEKDRAARFGDGIVVLERVHRFGAVIAAVADAIRRGDGDGVIEALRGGAGPEVVWVPVDAAASSSSSAGGLEPVQESAVAAGRAVIASARAGDARGALAALGAFRLLCAHRRGGYGVASWAAWIERRLAAEIDGFDPGRRDYVGRPLLITENDYELALYNGDTGVIVRDRPDRASAVFERGRELIAFTPTRLASVETVYAMTIHKSQGSQFDTAAVVLPDPRSRVLTRELLYTAVTRARARLILVGTEEMVRAAVGRPVARASGLRERLWGDH
jgi:exodeoxyribonuclease V alpha subunit